MKYVQEKLQQFPVQFAISLLSTMTNLLILHTKIKQISKQLPFHLKSATNKIYAVIRQKDQEAETNIIELVVNQSDMVKFEADVTQSS